LSRHESRGLHFSKDYPGMLDHPQPTVLTPNAFFKPGE
jgi:L-aspartate oxidase